jgi:hypothetical protein
VLKLAFGLALKGRGFIVLPNNSASDFVLKGRGFQPRRSAAKSTPALAAEVALSLQSHFFRSL